MKSAAPSAPAPDHLVGDTSPIRCAPPPEMSANWSRTSASEVVGSPSSDHPGPTCAATSRIGAANAAISPLGIAREGWLPRRSASAYASATAPATDCAEARSVAQRDDGPRFGRDRVGEGGEESGADGTERGGRARTRQRLQGSRGGGQVIGVGRAVGAERTDGICVDEHGDTTIESRRVVP